MRMVGLLGLVLALVVVGLLAKKQLGPVAPVREGVGVGAPADPRLQARQAEQQVKDALDAAAKARRMPDDE